MGSMDIRMKIKVVTLACMRMNIILFKTRVREWMDNIICYITRSYILIVIHTLNHILSFHDIGSISLNFSKKHFLIINK